MVSTTWAIALRHYERAVKIDGGANGRLFAVRAPKAIVCR